MTKKNLWQNEGNARNIDMRRMDAQPVHHDGSEASCALPLSDDMLYKLQERGEALLKRLEQILEVRLVPRGDKLQIFGGAAEAERARAVLRRLWQLAASGGEIDAVAINYQLTLWQQSLNNGQDDAAEQLGRPVYTTPKGKQIRPKTLGQLAYLQAIDKYDVTFGIGPAGTGKTYLAVMKAADALKKRLKESKKTEEQGINSQKIFDRKFADFQTEADIRKVFETKDAAKPALKNRLAELKRAHPKEFEQLKDQFKKRYPAYAKLTEEL